MSAPKRSLKGLSRRAKALLQRPEGVELAFKQSAGALDASDLVAFANSQSGGTILLGVKEERARDGRQIGKVIGYQIGDAARLPVLDKAMSCIPPVPIEICVEHTSAVPFLRLEILSGPDKPYCTNGGTYKIREDGRVRALHPRDLLNLLMEKEARLFEERFRQATSGLIAEMQSTAAAVADLNNTISSEIQDIASTLGWADMKVDDTASDIERTRTLTASVLTQVEESNRRLIALLKHANASDPIKEQARAQLIDDLTKEFKAKPKLLNNLKEGTQLSLRGDKRDLFSQDEVVALVLEAAQKVRAGIA